VEQLAMFMRCLCDVYAQASPLRSEEPPPSRQNTPRESTRQFGTSEWAAGSGLASTTNSLILVLQLP
jgi:hypothetical protein